MKERNYALGARIKAAMKAAGFTTAKEFCQRYKVPYLTVAQHIQGRRNPAPEFLKLYSKALGVSAAWLESGEGNPLVNSKKSQKIQKASDDELEKRMQLNQLLPTALDVPLLTDIIEQLMKNYIKDRHQAEKIAKGVSLIYSDIASANEEERIKQKLIKVAVNTFIQHVLC